MKQALVPEDRRRRRDALIDLLMSFPGIVLAGLLVTISGPNELVLIGVVALSFMPFTSRVVRSSTMQLRDSDFVRYAQGAGQLHQTVLGTEQPSLTRGTAPLEDELFTAETEFLVPNRTSSRWQTS